MASTHQITWLILVFLLVGGLVHGQDQESQEEAEGDAVRPGLPQILRPKQQRKPAAQGAGGGGDGDVESNEGGGLAQEAAAEQAEADEEAEQEAAEQAAEQAEADSEAAEDAAEAAQEAAEQTAEQSEAAEDAAEAAAEAAEAAAEAAEDAAEAAAEAAEDAAEAAGEAGEGEETGGEGPGLPPGTPVVGSGNNNNPNSPFFNVNGGQQVNQVGGAQMGGDAGESGEETEGGSMAGEQAAGGTTESGEQGTVIGQQGTGDAESTEEADAEDSVGPLISSPSSDADVEESYLSNSVSITGEEDGPETDGSPIETDQDLPDGSPIETDQDASSFQKPNLPVGPLFDKAKQVSSSGTTPTPASPEPTDPAGEKPGEEEGLSDSYKKRIAISGAAVGSIVLVGVIAVVIGRRVTRR
ncbi:circumsporozoite protein-like [Patiria miniata]|uniref:Uncharacterized protein n=1 Tax=Patiria miniata TaxID=46514 RepID=A0A914B5S1_PATMI|nr:circumsporozoite protein-like [Patiria miniata]